MTQYVQTYENTQSRVRALARACMRVRVNVLDFG
jgi:hypothetical protein